jgi:hypothetical protein
MYSGAASNKCRTSAPTAISAYHRRYELIVVVAGSRRVCLSFQRRSISDLDDKEGLARQWSLVFGGIKQKLQTTIIRFRISDLGSACDIAAAVRA